MVREGEKKTVLIPAGMLREMHDIMNKDDKWISEQEFIREAIKEKIEKWKKNQSYGTGELIGKT